MLAEVCLPTNEDQIWEQQVYAAGPQSLRGPDVVRWSTKAYFIRRFLRPTANLRVLDVGCGLGEYSLLVARAAREVVGVDASPTAVEAARWATERLGCDNATFITGDAYRLPELVGDRAPFDLAICFDLLEHLSQPQVVLDHLRQLLSPGGKALIYTNCFGRCSWAYLQERRRTSGKVGPLWLADERDHHFIRFTPAQLRELAAGWRVRFVYKNHFLIPAVSKLTAWLDKLGQKGRAPLAPVAQAGAEGGAPAHSLQLAPSPLRLPVLAVKQALSVLEMETLGCIAPGAGAYLLLEKR